MTTTMLAKNVKALRTAVLYAVTAAGFLGSMNPARAGFIDSDWRKGLLVGAGVGAGITSTFNPAAGLFSTAAGLSAYGTYQYFSKEDRAKMDIVNAKGDAQAFLLGSPLTPALTKAMSELRSRGIQSKDDREMAIHVISHAMKYRKDIEENCWLHPAVVCENGAIKGTTEPLRYTPTETAVERAPAVVPAEVPTSAYAEDAVVQEAR